MLILSKKDVQKAINLKEVIQAVEDAQLLNGQGLAVDSPIHSLFANTDPKILPEPHGNF